MTVAWYPFPPLGSTPAMAVIAATPASALLPGTFYPVNTTAGAVSVTLPLGAGNVLPLEGMMVGVGDYAGTSQTHAITVLAQGAGTTIGDPANHGNYASSVSIAQKGYIVWWRYAATPNQWIPVFWGL
jgi:hypothetical protein